MYAKCSVGCIAAVQLKKEEDNKTKRRDGQSPDTSGSPDITVGSDFSMWCHSALPKVLKGSYIPVKKEKDV